MKPVLDDTVALVTALRTLPERQRVVLVLHYLADLPVGQIAAELRCPIGSVKAWLSRGREGLALALKDSAEPHRARAPGWAAAGGPDTAGGSGWVPASGSEVTDA